MTNLQIHLLEKINADIDDFKKKIDNKLKIPENNLFSSALIYPLKAGGKRIRPILVYLVAGCFGGDAAIENARKYALALEMIHTYSLVHDDLPSMDNDDFRRNKPTTHKVFGEAQALLVGDGLLTEAFYQICQSSISSHGISILAELLAECSGIGGMIFGQWIDILQTNNKNSCFCEDILVQIHKEKTGKLLGACLAGGYVIGKLSRNPNLEKVQLEKNVDYWTELGILLGLAFQIYDDILDVTRTTAELGKTAKKDEEQHKLTAVALWGLDGAQQKAKEYTRKSLDLLEKNMANEKIEKTFYEEFKLMIESLINRNY